MDLDAKPYRAFVAIAEERSFVRAAARLGTSQPALSALIRELERRLGFAIFARTSRSVELTAQGRLFLGNARRVIAEAEGAAEAARAIRNNQLTIGASPGSVLVPDRMLLLERFQRLRPDVQIRVHNDSDVRNLAALTRHEVDLVLLVEPAAGATVGYSPLDPGAALTADLSRFVIRYMQIRLLIPKEDPLNRLKELSLEALQDRQIATFDRHQGIALTEAIRDAMDRVGAVEARPPERNPLAVERFGAVNRTLAWSLGWYGKDHLKGVEPMVSRKVEDFDVGTALTLLRTRGDDRQVATEFWQMASEFQKERRLTSNATQSAR